MLVVSSNEAPGLSVRHILDEVQSSCPVLLDGLGFRIVKRSGELETHNSYADLEKRGNVCVRFVRDRGYVSAEIRNRDG